MQISSHCWSVNKNPSLPSKNPIRWPIVRDQVPPKLELEERLESAYPYVKGKIDRHGNFIEVPGTRVAISPYLKYETLKQFCVVSAKAIDEQFAGERHPFYGFTYEKKSTFLIPKTDPNSQLSTTNDSVEEKITE